MALTRAQKRLIEEIDEIAEYHGVDRRGLVAEWEGTENLTDVLSIAKA
jgi:hypothetical protein